MLILFFGTRALHGQLMHFRFLKGDTYFSPWIGGVVSYFVGTFVFYWWHRIRHDSRLFWRVFHQIHHSPSRVQAVTAFYVHPVEALASSAVNGILVLVILGLPAESLLWNSTFASMAGIFYHMNLKTPRWVGYFLQRPEMHRYHHKLGVHGYNYGDIPIWDMIFGTHLNPPLFLGECGFGEGKELKLRQMLLFEDVNRL